MDLEETEARSDYAGEGHKQFNQLTNRRHRFSVHISMALCNLSNVWRSFTKVNTNYKHNLLILKFHDYY
jgi:hypothetical protein